MFVSHFYCICQRWVASTLGHGQKATVFNWLEVLGRVESLIQVFDSDHIENSQLSEYVSSVLSSNVRGPLSRDQEILNMDKLGSSFLESTEDDLMVGDELAAQIGSLVNSIYGAIDLF